jgi:hypothetical protein
VLDRGSVETERAYAVTAALRDAISGDDEELEYEASRAAADASLALVRADGAALRRVVLAADVPDAAAGPVRDDDVAAVSLSAPVPWSAIDSALVDPPGVPADGIEEEELGWYAVQELRALVQE